MTQSNMTKLKILYVHQILEDETDVDHGLTMAQIIERLGHYGIAAERKSVYRDLEALRDFGVDIKTYQRNPVEYAIATRTFELPELMLLVNAVESCKFLTIRQSNKLIANLKTFASDQQRPLLDRHIHVEGRIASTNDSVFSSINLIHEALRRNRKIVFTYYRFDSTGKRRPTHKGNSHEVTPVALSFTDGYYYLTAWDDAHESLVEYRLDRMGNIQVTETAATRNETITRHRYDEDDYVRFGRFTGKPITATLSVDGDKVEIIMDRFGKGARIQPADNDKAKAVVKVYVSEQFFGWLAGLGNTVSIENPPSLKTAYRDYLLGLVDAIDASDQTTS